MNAGNVNRWIAGAIAFALAVGCGVVPDDAQVASKQQSEELGPGLFPLDGFDPSLPNNDLKPLGEIVASSKYVGIGHAAHTSGGFYLMYNRVIRYLVEKKGFRAFAMENSWVRADALQGYINTCQGSIDDLILTNFYNEWQATEVRDLLHWICQWNLNHPGDKVAFYGFDVQTLPQRVGDANALFAFLAQLGIPSSDPRFTDIHACNDVTVSWRPFSSYPQSEYDKCQAALSAVESYFNANGAWIIQQTSAADLAWARVHLVSEQTGQESLFLQTHYAYGTSQWIAGQDARERGMAYVVLAIHGLRSPNAKTALWFANFHAVYNPGTATLLPSMGDKLRAQLGTDYKAVAMTGFAVYTDTFVCGYYDPESPDYGTPDRTDPIEPVLHALGEGDLLVRTRTDISHPAFLDIPRSIFDFWASLLGNSWDALIYLEVSPAMTPIGRPPCTP